MSSALPYELYEEFISYLWDDKEALKACSLSSRILINCSQKCLFYQIILANVSSIHGIGGSSSAFHRLLESSPHIAGYVECLQIFDANVTYHPEDAWLPNDTFLPLSLPLLCNLKAFFLHHVPSWDILCEKVRRSLQDLIRVPSLVFLDLVAHPTILLTEVSRNLKHFTIRENFNGTPCTLLPLDHSSYSPIFLETLFVYETQDSGFLIPLTSDPKFRFKANQLRKLVLEIETDDALQHRALWPLLHSCRKTLEEFTLITCVQSIDVGTPRYTSIDLSQMTALKALTLYLCISDYVAFDDWDPLWCFNNLLRSASSTLQLEEITLIMELYKRSFKDAYHIRHWDDISDILVDPTRCPCLAKLTIHTTDLEYQISKRGFIDGSSEYYYQNSLRVGPLSFITLLNASKGMEKLRARPDIEVITMVRTKDVDRSSPAPDTRWRNVGFTGV